MDTEEFEDGVSLAERFVNDQDLDKAIRIVLETFDSVEHQAKGRNCEFRPQQGCFGGFSNGIREIIISIHSWTQCWST